MVNDYDQCTEGKRGGFSHLAFLCAFAMPARGMSVHSVSGGSWLPWHKVIELDAGRVSKASTPISLYAQALQVFYYGPVKCKFNLGSG